MKITRIAHIAAGQDGAIWGDELFRFDHDGSGQLYSLKEIRRQAEQGGRVELLTTYEEAGHGGRLEPLATFVLDKAEILAPHSNAVMFGTEKYSREDEFPLLYTNIYNNYAGTENPLKGVCCVYRLQRKDGGIVSTLVQLIEIGFVEDAALWKAEEKQDGPRPYGNFAIDAETNRYWAFTMRNEKLGTRYFAFDLPRITDGCMDETYGVRRVVLKTEDIKEQFDCEFHRFIQGAAVHKGKLYSVEGFSGDRVNRPAFRVIDLAGKCQEKYVDITQIGIWEEPELIDFCGDECYYADAYGNLYQIDFE